MNGNPMMNDRKKNDTPMNQTEQILEQLRPRMHKARVSHIRRMVGTVAVIPLLGIGAMAMAAEADAPTQIETAVAADDPVEPQVELPDIGDARDDAPTTTTTAPVTTTTEAVDPVQELEVGVLGKVEVKPTETGFEVMSHSLVEGWEIIEYETTDDGSLVIYVANGDLVKTITITSGIRDDVLVVVDDWTPPTTTTTTAKPEPKPEPTPEPPPVIVDRFIVEVPGKGNFVVEREGDTLWAGNVTAYEGYEFDVIQAEGWKVYVGFYADNHVWYGKALINDSGEVEQHFWDEAVAPQPVYQWVEIPQVGAAKFAILEGQLMVAKTETAPGFASWDYGQGAWGPTAKVDFEGEGQIWFIDAWLTETGELGWNSYQG